MSRAPGQGFTTIRVPTQIYRVLRERADSLGVPIYELLVPLVGGSGVLVGRKTRRHRGVGAKRKRSRRHRGR